jgi:two-component system, cell cycle response regulator DivK
MLILVVDDYEDTRDVLKLLLERHGHSVALAANGREAVEAARRHAPHAVLMDLNMPVMDGLEATRLLRSSPQTAALPVLALTAHGDDPGCQAEALASGCNECIAKPVDIPTLGAALQRIRPDTAPTA